MATGISQLVQTDEVSGLKSLEKNQHQRLCLKKKKNRLLKGGLFHPDPLNCWQSDRGHVLPFGDKEASANTRSLSGGLSSLR